MTTKEELELIRGKHGGMLRPKDVVTFARDPKTSLHNRFVWDDTEAAQKYRIVQAHKIIRVTVTMIPHKNETFRAYVSLLGDRGGRNGGYRAVVEVLTDDDLRAAMLEEALAELDVFRERYGKLEALASVFEALDKVSKKTRKTRKRKSA